VPGPGPGGAQPVPLVVVAEQHMRDGQAGQFGVGYLRRPARPGPGEPREGIMRSVSPA
jgi:hypothetical protein